MATAKKAAKKAPAKKAAKKAPAKKAYGWAPPAPPPKKPKTDTKKD